MQLRLQRNLTSSIEEPLRPQRSSDEASQSAPDCQVADVALRLIAGHNCPDARDQERSNCLGLFAKNIEDLHKTTPVVMGSTEQQHLP